MFINESLFFLQSIIVALVALAVRRIGSYALVTYIAVLAVLANLFCLKTITLFGMTASSADVFAIGSYVSFALLKRDEHSPSSAKVTFVIFSILLFYMIITQLNLLFVPAPGDMFAGHCAALLSPMPRLMIASLVAYGISFFITGILLDWSKRLAGFVPAFMSMVTVLLITQLLDTIIFSLLGLYGLVPHVWQIIAMSFIIKAIGVILMMVASQCCTDE